MGNEKYAAALDKLIDAREEIARLSAELAEAREYIGNLLALPVSDELHEAIRTRARAWLDREDAAR